MKPDQNKTGVSKMAAAVSSRTNFRIVTAILTGQHGCGNECRQLCMEAKEDRRPSRSQGQLPAPGMHCGALDCVSGRAPLGDCRDAQHAPCGYRHEPV